MKKLFYIANIRFPTERAHGIQVAHMCAAFARQNHGTESERERGTDTEKIKVTLLAPERKTFSEDPFEYYGVERNFTIEKIPVPDIVRFGRIGFFIESLIFAWRAAKRISVKDSTPLNPPYRSGTPFASEDGRSRSCEALSIRFSPSKEMGRETIIYTRDELPLLFLPRGSIFYEAHQIRRSFFFRFLLRRAAGIIAISHGLKEALVKSGYPRERIMVAPDGYDEKAFSVRIDKNEARKQLGLPKDARVAMYIGGLEAWKGAETLCKAARSLAEANILVAIIGGTKEEISKLEPKYPKVRFLGSRPYRELSINQQAADILIVPNSATSEIGSRFTSPLKLFAHMASGVLMVVANVPALTEVVNWSQTFPFTPDDPLNLAYAVKRALSSDFLSQRLSKAREAEKRARDFTWDKRAENVLAYIQWQREKKSL